jgi:5-methylcytosine-specific restriction endonuclease McrA
MVYVLASDGRPLMPTERHGKVKRMLKQGRAKVVKRMPFTIQLLYDSPHYTQPVTLGVDAGSKTVGLSATTKEKELYSAECQLRNDLVEKLATRRALRSARRSRKTRYRKARFCNRKRSEGWLAPSIRQKINTHMQLVEQAHKILPISKVVVETAAFDIQKIRNPELTGDEYQKGEQLGFWNVREYVLFRDGHKCQHCHGKSKDSILNVHHIESRKTGGDAPNNLITLCETCHGKHHKGEITIKVKRGESFKDAAFMGIMRWTLYGRLKLEYENVTLTYGYITKNTRIMHGLEKTHCVDARCISGHPLADPTGYCYTQKAVRRHNRQLHKFTIFKGGYRRANQSPKYVRGFQLFDKVCMLDGKVGFVFGRRATGSFDVRRLNGDKLSAGISCKKLKLLERAKTILTERQVGAVSSTWLKPVVSTAQMR